MKRSSIVELYILRIGKNIEYTCIGDAYVRVHTVTTELDAMVWMWNNCGVDMKEFKKAIGQLNKNKHTHARFSSNGKLFLYTDMDSLS